MRNLGLVLRTKVPNIKKHMLENRKRRKSKIESMQQKLRSERYRNGVPSVSDIADEKTEYLDAWFDYTRNSSNLSDDYY